MFVYYQCIIMYYYFQSLTIDRELQEIGANQAELAPFAHTHCKSREIRTIHSHYTLHFRCLTSGRERSEVTVNQAKFARFAPISREFRALRTKINTCN